LTLEGRLVAAGLGVLVGPLAEAGYDDIHLMQEMNDDEWAELAEELGSALDEQSFLDLRLCVHQTPGTANAAPRLDAAGSPRRDLAADVASFAHQNDGTLEQMAEKLRVAEKLLAEAIRARTDAEASSEARTRALQVENVRLKRDQMQLKADLSRKVDSYLLELI
jgi:hypothetical protein